MTHRMALDHSDKVTKAVLIDIVPTYYLYTHVTIDFVQAYFHWFNYLRAAPAPENELLAQREAKPAAQQSPAQAEYQRTNGTPEGMHGMCEDYRAGASIDLQHDAADLDTKIRCPLHLLWAENGAMDRLYDVLAIWRERGTRHRQRHAGRPQHAGRRAGRGARRAQELLARLEETTAGHAILAGKRRAGRHPSKALFPTADRRPSIPRPPQRRRVMTRSSHLRISALLGSPA